MDYILVLDRSDVESLISTIRQNQANLVYLSQLDGDSDTLMTNSVAFVCNKLWGKYMLA